MAERTDNWLVVASGPSAEKYIDAALSDEEWITFGVNKGILVIGSRVVPDYVWLSDTWAIHKYRKRVEAYQQLGTRWITSDSAFRIWRKHIENKEQRKKPRAKGLDWSAFPADHKVSTKNNRDTYFFVRTKRNLYLASRWSGPMALQYAARRARRVIGLVGFDGYPKEDGKLSERQQEILRCIGGIMKRHKRLIYRWYGIPNYDIPKGKYVELVHAS